MTIKYFLFKNIPYLKVTLKLQQYKNCISPKRTILQCKFQHNSDFLVKIVNFYTYKRLI